MKQSHILLLLVVLPAIFAAPDKCVDTTKACEDGCEQRGFISDESKCRYPIIEECKEAGKCADADKDKTQACILIGMEKKDTEGNCVSPTACTTAGQSNCSSEKIVCTSLGFIKSETTDDCIYPKNCLTESKKPCDDGKACRQLGYEVDDQTDKTCKIPSDCTSGDHCQTPKTACIEAGFTKNNNNNTCVCQGPLKVIEGTSSKKCVNCKSDSKCSDACIALGWVTSGDKCVEPADCLTQAKGCASNKFCLVVKGFVAKSGTDNSCMVPKCDEAGKSYCSNPSFVCVSTNQFTKKQNSNECECVSPKVIQNNECITKVKTSSMKLLFSFVSLLALILV